jgi:hypothetical protein
MHRTSYYKTFGVKVIILIGLAIAFLGLGNSCKFQRPVTAEAQIRRIAATVSGRDSFALSELCDMPSWSKLYVFGPYTPTSRIQQTLGFEWKEAGSFGLDASECGSFSGFPGLQWQLRCFTAAKTIFAIRGSNCFLKDEEGKKF